MRHEQHRTPEAAVSLLGRSLGNAARFVRQLVPRRRTVAAPETGDAGSAALRDYERMRRQLAAEVARLESEVERLHAVITSNTVPVRGAGGRGSLEQLLDESRQKREQCHEKRQELLRVERHIQRERRLGPLEPPEVKLRRGAAPRQRASTQGAQRAARSDARPASGLRAAVARAVERSSFASQAERLAFQRLAEKLLDDNEDDRRDAVTALAGFRSPAVPELLLAAVHDPSERVRLSALNALVGSTHHASADAFRRYLGDSNSALRLSALRGLASLDPRFLSNAELIARTEDDDAAIRRTAANILGWRRDGSNQPDVVHALALALHDEEEDVRAAAAEALGNWGDHRGVLALINALQDSSASVSDSAERALGGLLGEQVAHVGEGMSKADRVATLKGWWKDTRADAYLTQHAGDLPMDGSGAHAPPPPPPPPQRPAPRADVAERAAAPPAKQAAPPVAQAKPDKSKSPAAPAKVEPAPAAPRARAEAAPVATAESIAGAFSEMEGGEEGDESAEDFENVFGGGGEEAEALAKQAASPKPAEEKPAKAKPSKVEPAAVEATAGQEGEGAEEAEEEGEGGEGAEGGFEDIFGGGGGE